MNELMVLAALLSAPDFLAREAASRALVRAGPAALPVLDALAVGSSDPEIAYRADAAAEAVRRGAAVALLRGTAPPTDGEVAYWSSGRAAVALQRAARDLGVGEEYSTIPTYVRPPAVALRAYVGWCRNQIAYPPGHPLRWPWPVTWAFCATAWRW